MRRGPGTRKPLSVRGILLAFAMLAVAFDCRAQKTAHWQAYRLADGLPESGCIAVTVSSQRKVLARHLTAPFITELDGYTNKIIPAPESLKSRIYQSPAGQLWTVAPGGLQEFRQGTWVLHPLEALASRQEPGARVIDPIPLHPVRQGIVLFLQPDGLMEFSTEDPAGPSTRLLRASTATSIGRFSGMTPARDGGLWITGASGLAHVPGPLRLLKPDTAWREFVLPDQLGITNLHAPQEERVRVPQPANSFFVTTLAEISTNENKVALTFDGRDWRVLMPGEYRLRHAWRGPEAKSWGMAINGVFQWQQSGSGIREVEEISARQYFDVAVEVGGAFWLATSDGLFRYSAMLWSTPDSLRGIVGPIQCLASERDGKLWFCTNTRLHLLHHGNLSEFALPTSSQMRPRAIYVMKPDLLVIALEDAESEGTDQLFQFIPSTGNLLPLPRAPRRVRALGTLVDGTLCVQNLTAARIQGVSGFQLYDGTVFANLPDPLPPGAVGTNLNVTFVSQGGDLWVGGDGGVALLHDNAWRLFSTTERFAPDESFFFAELPDGKIWSAAHDQLWEFDGRNWTVVRRDFDRINGLMRARDGSVWVASNNGAHRFFRGAWAGHTVEEGLPAAGVRALQETGQGVWLATTRGLTLFHPEADPETDPPETWITKLAGEDQSGGEAGPVTISFTGRDKWDHTPRSRLLFSYRLDESDWSPFQEMDSVSFTELDAGKHYFQVRAMDRNSSMDPKPAQLEFSIVLPWYRETRLVLIALAGICAALFFGSLALNKHLQLLRSYAEVEQKVAERTRQLEIASRELLQSQKMNALGTLAAGIAHDFNNILSIIKGSAQIIEDNLDDPTKIQTRTDRIKTVVEQGAGIIKAMLGFSRESGPSLELCDINSVVQDTVRLLGDRFLREVQVQFKPAAGLPQTAITRDFVQQILLNFIFNAAESMPARKEIIITCRRMNEAPVELTLAPSPAPSYVAISVQDFGCGIAPEILPRIFEPFFTTKALSTRRGTGLGLSMAYELARKLGAGLAVHSTFQQGSTFTLLLPIRDLPAAPDLQTPKQQSEPALPV